MDIKRKCILGKIMSKEYCPVCQRDYHNVENHICPNCDFDFGLDKNENL